MDNTTQDIYYRSPQAIFAPALSFLALILCIPPMVWHASTRNWGASFLVAFTIYGDIINILNALIWPTDDINSWWNGAVYCDIQVKFDIATQIGIPGALLCIFRSLAIVMDADNAVLIPSRAQRLWNKAFDIFFCIGLPVLAMITHFFVQGQRYVIFAIAGCNTTFDESWPTIALSYVWPVIVCVAAACYCILIVVRLVKYTSEFTAILGASRSNLTTKRFTRLFGLSLIMIVIILPLQTYVFYTNIQNMLPLHPYSWKALHGSSLEVILMVQTNGNFKFDRWIPVGCSFLIFAFFGLGQDAANMYHSFFEAVGLKSLSTSLSSRKATSSVGTRSGTWYSSLRSKHSSWLGTRKESKGAKKFKETIEINGISVSSSNEDAAMSGGLHGDTSIHNITSYDRMLLEVDLPIRGFSVNDSHSKNDCIV